MVPSNAKLFAQYPVGTVVQFCAGHTKVKRRIVAHVHLENNKGYDFGLVFHDSVHGHPIYFNDKAVSVLNHTIYKVE